MMKYRLLFQMASVILALSIPGLDIQANEPGEPNLTLTIHCPKDEIKQGDEIPIVFTITNKGKSAYSYYDASNYSRVRSRLGEYCLVARRENGTVVADLGGRFVGTYGYGGFPKQQIEPGESFTKTVALNQWALINEPDRYNITGIYYTGIFHLRKKHLAVSSTPIKIIVKPRTDEEMTNYIRELSNKLEVIKIPKTGMTKKASKKIVATVKKLMYTCDPRIVPTLIDTMYKYPHSGFWVVQAFLYYLPREPEIKNAILEAAKKRGLAYHMQYPLEQLGCTEEEFKEIILLSLASENPDIQSAGAQAALYYPDDVYMSRLIAIATDVNSRARGPAICALAWHRTDEGVKTLKALLRSPDEVIRNIVSYAVRNAYRFVPLYPKYPDDEYTSELIDATKDPNNLEWVFTFGISEIVRTRTEEGVKAIKLLLEDPDKGIPIAKTDEGVKAVKALLNNPDKNIRERTADAIYWLYKAHPDWPLKKDDFPELFREILGEREANKRIVLEWLRNK